MHNLYIMLKEKLSKTKIVLMATLLVLSLGLTSFDRSDCLVISELY